MADCSGLWCVFRGAGRLPQRWRASDPQSTAAPRGDHMGTLRGEDWDERWQHCVGMSLFWCISDKWGQILQYYWLQFWGETKNFIQPMNNLHTSEDSYRPDYLKNKYCHSHLNRNPGSFHQLRIKNSSGIYIGSKVFAVWTKRIIKTYSEIALFAQATEIWLTEGLTSEDHINDHSHDIQTYWGDSCGIQLAPNKTLWRASILTI